ncbi:MAG: GldG family protein [Gammaproteobacteria bacterium]
MEMNKKTRLEFKFQNVTFIILFLGIVGILAWLSQRYNIDADWTATGRNTLNEVSTKLLSRMDKPVHITAFARESQLLTTRQTIQEFIARYQKHKDDIEVTYINPDTAPDITRQMGITVDGELVVEYEGRKEHVQSLKEEILTNTLQRLMRSGEQHVVFISGHGERNPVGRANFDLGSFSQHLAEKGIKNSTITLNETPKIPADTAVLVIAGPQVDLLPGEVKLIEEYIKSGGNLLWLHDPGKLFGLEPVAKQLGIKFVKGVVVDPTTQLLGIGDPSFALVNRYNNHPIVRDFAFMSIFPQAAAIEYQQQDNTEASEFLQTVSRSWSETGAIQGTISYDKDKEQLGPLTIGLALTREHKTSDEKPAQQRIVVLGDGDFLSNAYLGNQGNQDLGYNIFNWLSHEDNFIAIPVTVAPDKELTVSTTMGITIGFLFLIILPLVLLASGIFIWLKRRKQ